VTTLPLGFVLLQVTPRLDAGGVEQTTLDIARAVVRAGGRAIVASRGGRLAARLRSVGAELVELPVQSKNPLTMAANALRLQRLIRREGVSVVHARSRAPAVSALLAARAAGVPFVATYAGIYNARSGLKRWYNSVMTRGDLVIANSDYTRAHLIAAHGVDPLKVVTIHRGIDLSALDPRAVAPERVERVRAAWGLAPTDSRPVVLLPARLTRWKGQALMVEAAALLQARGVDDFVLVMAGDDQGRFAYRAELRAAVLAHGLEGRVHVAEHCGDMPAAYLAADLVVTPSLEPEAFGRTAVEAQAMGRPVLAADHGAVRETVLDGETGWLVPPGDVEAWADALEAALAAGPRAWTRMGQEGIARARDLFSLEAMTAATLAVYDEVLAIRAAAPA
jgi:glycosyltransferase involved in cell wall biosynthesis